MKKVVGFFKFNKILTHPERVVTSWFTRRPELLLFIRGIFFIYCLIVLIGSIYIDARNKELHMFLTYFTNLAFIGLTDSRLCFLQISTFQTAFVHSLSFVINKQPKTLKNQPRAFTIAFWFLYDTILVNHILVPIVFWSILVPGKASTYDIQRDPIKIWRNVSTHGFDLIMVMTEVFFNRMPFVNTHWIIIIIELVLYLLLARINYAINRVFPYYFLNWEQGSIIFWYYFAVLGVALLAYFIQKGIHSLRDSIGRGIWRKKLMEEMQVHQEPVSTGNQDQEGRRGPIEKGSEDLEMQLRDTQSISDPQYFNEKGIIFPPPATLASYKIYDHQQSGGRDIEKNINRLEESSSGITALTNSQIY
ncbi:hypothetical protein G9A89_004405 [Geosiphon pyriformis]|nr:hypothetical protein G9A89_004405 [Geosiphon pyriformis]